MQLQNDPLSVLQPGCDENGLRKFLMKTMINNGWLAGLVLYLEREYKSDLKSPFATDGRKLYYGPNWNKVSLEQRLTSLGHICLHLMCEHYRIPKMVLDHRFVYGPIVTQLWSLACDMIVEIWLPSLGLHWGVWSKGTSNRGDDQVDHFGALVRNQLNIDRNDTALSAYQKIFNALHICKSSYRSHGGSRTYFRIVLKEIRENLERMTTYNYNYRSESHIIRKVSDEIDQVFDDENLSEEQLQQETLRLLYRAFGRKFNPADDHLFIKHDGSQIVQDKHVNSIVHISQQIQEYIKNCGKMPADFSEYLNHLNEHKLSWLELVSQYLSLERGDLSWKRLNKRYLWNKIYLPGVDHRMRLDVYVALDTSGSMSEEELRQSVSEIYGLCSNFDHFTVTLIQCDCSIKSVQEFDEFTQPDELKEKLKRISGQGGTNYWPVFKYIWKQIDEQGADPKLLVYFTDLCITGSELPQDPPSFPVIWVRTCKQKYYSPSYGLIVDFS